MFIRVISDLKKWSNHLQDDEKTPSDCFGDLLTKENTLSLWKIEDSDPPELQRKLITVVSINKMKISDIKYVKIEENELSNLGLIPVPDDPQLKYIDKRWVDFISRHHDITEIDSNMLCTIADFLYKKIKAGDIDFIDGNDVLTIYKSMCTEGLVLIDQLQPPMKKLLSE